MGQATFLGDTRVYENERDLICTGCLNETDGPVYQLFIGCPKKKFRCSIQKSPKVVCLVVLFLDFFGPKRQGNIFLRSPINALITVLVARHMSYWLFCLKSWPLTPRVFFLSMVETNKNIN